MAEYTISNADANVVAADVNGHLYVGETTGDVVAYDSDGTVLWTNTDEVGDGSTVTAIHADGGIVYVGQGGEVYQLNASDGTTRTSPILVNSNGIDAIWGNGGDDTWIASQSTAYRYVGNGGWNTTGDSFTHPNSRGLSDITVKGGSAYVSSAAAGSSEDNTFVLDATTMAVQSSAHTIGNNAFAIDYNTTTGRVYVSGSYITEFSTFADEIRAFSNDLTTEHWRYDAGDSTVAVDDIRYDASDGELYAVGENGNLNRYVDSNDDPKLAAEYSSANGNFTNFALVDSSFHGAVVPSTEVQSISDTSYNVLLETVSASQPASVASMNIGGTQSVVSVQATQTTVTALMSGTTKVSPVAEQYTVGASMNTAQAENLYKYATATQATATAVDTVAVAEDEDTAWYIFDSDGEQHKATLIEYTGQVPDWERGQEFSRVFVFSQEDVDNAYDKLKTKFGRYLRDETVTVSRDYRGSPYYTQNAAQTAPKDDFLFKIQPNPSADMADFWCVVTGITDATRVAEGGKALELTMVPLVPADEYSRRDVRRQFEVTV